MVRTPDIAPHVTSDLMKRTQFHRGFLRHLFFFIKLQQLDHGAFDYLTKGTLRSAEFAQFSSVCAVESAHSAHERTFHCAYHSFRATAHLGATFSKKKHFLLLRLHLPFLASGERTSSCSMYFVVSFFSFSRKLRKSALVTHK